jgi:hypothetical protein
LEHLLGVPLRASTRWGIVEEAAETIQAARDELIRQAAQGDVLHSDDTSMRVLHLAREPRNTPKLSDDAEILVANCLAHGRRQFVEVASTFREECRYVLERLGSVYKYDAEARAGKLTPEERLQFHQQ